MADRMPWVRASDKPPAWPLTHSVFAVPLVLWVSLKADGWVTVCLGGLVWVGKHYWHNHAAFMSGHHPTSTPRPHRGVVEQPLKAYDCLGPTAALGMKGTRQGTHCDTRVADTTCHILAPSQDLTASAPRDAHRQRSTGQWQWVYVTARIPTNKQRPSVSPHQVPAHRRPERPPPPPFLSPMLGAPAAR